MSAPAPVTLTALTAERILEVLNYCEEFLRTAGPLVHAELATYLEDYHPPTDVSWLLDSIGAEAQHLRRLLQPCPHNAQETLR
ncbi:MAG: hypothetical protein M3P83_01200 [Actinomycetota bacterium]|nr:hypothetical protein [Actinomycetota bacterium]